MSSPSILSLTGIRWLGVSTTQQAKQIADFLVRQQLLQPIGETLFEAREVLRKRFALATEQVTEQVLRLLSICDGQHSRSELQNRLQLKHHNSFTAAYLQPALATGIIEMTIPDKPNSSKQRYRLTTLGSAIKQDQEQTKTETRS